MQVWPSVKIESIQAKLAKDKLRHDDYLNARARIYEIIRRFFI